MVDVQTALWAEHVRLIDDNMQLSAVGWYPIVLQECTGRFN